MVALNLAQCARTVVVIGYVRSILQSFPKRDVMAKILHNLVLCISIFQSYVNESTNDEKCWHHYGVPVFHEG